MSGQERGAERAEVSLQEAADVHNNPYKQDFPLLAENPGLAFLDSAATAQRPARVLDAQRRFYETMNANPLRGLYRLSVEATEAIAEVRGKTARFIGAADPDCVVFVRNASEALNLAARGLAAVQGLKPGDEVCISIMEHHSNLIPWQQACAAAGAKLVYLRPDPEDGYRIRQEEIDAKIGPATRIVSVGHVSNVLGVENPVRAIADRAHEMGALVVVDGAQSVPHMRVDVEALGCDAFAFSAHKVMGPLGVGVLWARRELLEATPPMLFGGEMIDWVSEQDAAWAPIPEKFEAGTQDAAGIYAFGEALGYLEGVGFPAIEARERALMEYLVGRMAELPFIDIVGPAEASRRYGALAFTMKGVHPHDVASILDDWDVDIRAGHHCAQPLHEWLGVPSTNRASVAFYNDAHDIDRLVEALGGVWGMFHGGK